MACIPIDRHNIYKSYCCEKDCIGCLGANLYNVVGMNLGLVPKFCKHFHFISFV